MTKMCQMSVYSTVTQDIAQSLEAESRMRKKKKSARLRELEENPQRMEAARAAESMNVGSAQGMPMSQEQMNFPTQAQHPPLPQFSVQRPALSGYQVIQHPGATPAAFTYRGGPPPGWAGARSIPSLPGFAFQPDLRHPHGGYYVPTSSPDWTRQYQAQMPAMLPPQLVQPTLTQHPSQVPVRTRVPGHDATAISREPPGAH